MNIKKVFTNGVLIMLFLCSLFVLTSCAAFQTAGKSDVSIVPSKGSKGASVVITGDRFVAGEEIDIVMTLGEGVRVGMGTEKVDIIVADSLGSFKVKSAIPSMAKPGIYPVVIEGNKGSRITSSIEVVGKR